MAKTLASLFPNPDDLVALEPEDLGAVLLEVIPALLQNDMVSFGGIIMPLYPPYGPYPPGSHRPVRIALAEAISWLISQGLIARDPEQPADQYRLTRRAQTLRSRLDVEAYVKGRILPIELLHPILAEKVRPMFLRGDYDVAVFQAFKVVEVEVRRAANAKGAGYPEDLLGVTLMRKAFHPDNGPLTDSAKPQGEREGEMALFAGAIACMKNPGSHRKVSIKPEEAARMVVFASYLLDLVDERAALPVTP
ncbi:MAG TPA: TIGR02391 family protein [Alphaproteobacteria bacterium]|nr:TIGR02391 family protein [Alphaproteobacteria bacterium]